MIDTGKRAGVQKRTSPTRTCCGLWRSSEWMASLSRALIALDSASAAAVESLSKHCAT